MRLDTNMVIQQLKNRPEYIRLVTDWLYEAFVKDHSPDFSYEDLLESIKSREIYILLDRDQCVGTVSLFDNDLKRLPELTPWLAALYVDECYRGRGYAKVLIKHLVSEVEKRGYQQLYLRTETAGEYYKKLGWTFYMDITDEYGVETRVYRWFF